MLNYKKFLSEEMLLEAEGKNLHLEHLEDEIFNGGVNGTRGAINFLQSLRDMLAGHSKKSVTITVKWDGAPAIFAGINPENGKFFVGTKSVFNKTPKINYTERDIDENHPGGGLNEKLKYALRYLRGLNFKGVIQGDMMFTNNDLKTENIDGEEYITFQPNTIVYAVPKNSQLGKEITSAKMGVVWHTTYTGTSMSEMKASFGADAKSLGRSRAVWSQDATFVDASGAATMTGAETNIITKNLQLIGATFQKIPGSLLNQIANNGQLQLLIKTYNNTHIREGRKVTNPNHHYVGLIKWLEERYQKEMDKVKSASAKERKEKELKELVHFFTKNRVHFMNIFAMMNMFIDVKNFIIRKLQQVKQIGTFLRTDNGFKVTAPEGFVAIDHIGNAVKLVDRLEFSLANFTAAKAWDK